MSIRTAKQMSVEQQRRERIRALRSEIARYDAPSSLGPRHDAHVRARWDAHANKLRALLGELT